MITAWAVTTGEAGMRTQARGLAQAVADIVVEKTAPRGWLDAWRGSPDADRFEAPWPDVMISCGRRSARYALSLRRRMPSKVIAVHIQDPRAGAARFDLVVAMAHDRIAPGGNVIKVETALHDLTPEGLAIAARSWRDRLVPFGRPLVGVLIGGSTARQAFTMDHARRMITGLQRLRDASEALAIVPSRRTPPAVGALLRDAFGGDAGVFQWDLSGDNPYRGVLALADRLVVTSDSVSMISEALATSAPVDIFDFGTAHYGRFLGRMVEQGWARRFDGAPAAIDRRAPIDATGTAAEAVRRLLQARTGASG